MAAENTHHAEDLYASAVRAGAVEGRSPGAQIEHWARIGRQVTRHDSATRARIEQVIAGQLPWTALMPPEREVANALIDDAVAVAAASTSLGQVAADNGIVTVALDDDGQLCEYRPDGTKTLLR